MRGDPHMRLDLRDRLLAMEAAGALVSVHTTTPGVEVVAPGGAFPETAGPLCRIELGGVGVAGLGRTVDDAIEDALARWEWKADAVRAPLWTVTVGPRVVSQAGDDVVCYRWVLSRSGHEDAIVDVEVTTALSAAAADQWPGAAEAIASEGRSEAEAVARWRWPPRKCRYLAAAARDVGPYGTLEREGGEPQSRRKGARIEFRRFRQTWDRQVPHDLDVHLLLDNASRHKTPAIRRWLAARPRFHLHVTPTSASWLDLFERWFAELTTKRSPGP